MGDIIKLDGEPGAQCLIRTHVSSETFEPICSRELVDKKEMAEEKGKVSCAIYMQSFYLPPDDAMTLLTLVCKGKGSGSKSPAQKKQTKEKIL
jgi:hypothetical protein